MTAGPALGGVSAQCALSTCNEVLISRGKECVMTGSRATILERSKRTVTRGFVIGELLTALLLLAVAVSSLAALMYSVSRRPATRAETDCVAGDAARGKCVPEKPPQITESPLLRPGCATQSVFDQRKCVDTDASPAQSEGAVIRARTDSASMALLARKHKERRSAERADQGFIR
jgi:hypothetical protein